VIKVSKRERDNSMVAVGDFGIREREGMVRLALQRGWIHAAERMARSHGCADPVVLLVARDALAALPLKLSSPGRDRTSEKIQRKSGCRPFITGSTSYAALLRCNAADGWQHDMEEMRRKGGTSVVCINQTGQFLVAINPVSDDEGQG
jgi:hypothetical protein